MSDLILAQNQALRAKTESTYGVAPTMTDSDAIIASTISVKIDYNSVDANLALTERGGKRKKFAYKKATLDIECELALGGDDETPVPGELPQFDALLKACAMQRVQETDVETDSIQTGVRDALVLASGASATDDFYTGRSVALTIATGTAQAPGSTAKNIVKLAATLAENGGTTGAGSTDTDIVLASTASTIDDDYVGQVLDIGAESKTITAYDGATKTATVGSAFVGDTTEVAYKVRFETDGLAGYLITVKHSNGTIIDTTENTSTKRIIYLPSDVGTESLAGCDLKITTGSNPAETIKIASYNKTTRRAKLKSALQVEPTSSSTFEVLETRTINAFDASTKVVTLKNNLVLVTDSSTTYELQQSRIVTSYDGTTKRATVSPPFNRNVRNGATYVFNPYVEYSALPSKTGEGSCAIQFYNDGFYYQFKGVKGNFMVTANNGESAMIKFSMQGMVDVYDDLDMPAEQLSRYVPSLVCSSENTINILLAGISNLVVHKFEYDMGNDVKFRDVDSRAFITDHAPTIKCTIDKPLTADWDFQAQLGDNTKATTFWGVGDIGNQVVVFAENGQLTNPQDSDTDSVRTLDVEIMVTSGLKRLVFN